jgi:hypothetical protein
MANKRVGEMTDAELKLLANVLGIQFKTWGPYDSAHEEDADSAHEEDADSAHEEDADSVHEEEDNEGRMQLALFLTEEADTELCARALADMQDRLVLEGHVGKITKIRWCWDDLWDRETPKDALVYVENQEQRLTDLFTRRHPACAALGYNNTVVMATGRVRLYLTT